MCQQRARIHPHCSSVPEHLGQQHLPASASKEAVLALQATQQERLQLPLENANLRSP